MVNTNNNSPIEEQQPERTPEEAALSMRLRIFGRLKWLLILGVIIATLVASRVFHIGFPTLPVYIISAVMAGYNLTLVLQARKLETMPSGLVIPRIRTLSNIHMVLDLVALTVMLHFTGGIENPFIFFFVFHVITASVALHYRVVYWLATAATLMVTLLVMLEYAGVISHINLTGFASPALYREAPYILAVLVALAAILFFTSYLATAISGELRKRQRQVVEL
ncbi:MAG: hypothetical protein FJ025_03495, partial [Chloroflexi bacterium]|nr:hypothetical protein [Chloroflexota bacterium]